MTDKISNFSQLARTLGVSRQRATRLAKSPGWAFGNPPWPAAVAGKIVADHARRRAESNAVGDDDEGAVDLDGIGSFDEAIRRLLPKSPVSAARIKSAQERWIAVEQKRRIEVGDYILKSEVERGRIARVYAVRAGLADIPLQAHRFVGKSEAEIAAELTAMVRAVCNRFADGGGDDE